MPYPFNSDLLVGYDGSEDHFLGALLLEEETRDQIAAGVDITKIYSTNPVEANVTYAQEEIWVTCWKSTLGVDVTPFRRVVLCRRWHPSRDYVLHPRGLLIWPVVCSAVGVYCFTFEGQGCSRIYGSWMDLKSTGRKEDVLLNMVGIILLVGFPNLKIGAS